MFGLFKKKPILSDEDINFQIETFKWLLSEFGGDDFYLHTQLILPTKEFFPDEYSSSQQAIEGTFQKVREYCNMSGWECKLEAHEEAPDVQVDEFLTIQNAPQIPSGTFRLDDESKEIVISYEPNIHSNPNQTK